MKKNKLFALSAATIALVLTGCVNVSQETPYVPSVLPSAPDHHDVSSYDPADVELDVVRVTGITLDRTTINGKIGDTVKLNATVAPANAFDKNVAFTSSDMFVATVAGDGTVKLVGNGKAVITAKSIDGGFEAKCNVTVAEYQTVTVRNAKNVTTKCWNVAANEEDTTNFVSKDASNNSTYKYEKGALIYIYSDFDWEKCYVSGYTYSDKNGHVLGRAGAMNGLYYIALPENVDSIIVSPIVEEYEEWNQNETYSINYDFFGNYGIEAISGMTSNRAGLYADLEAKCEFNINLKAGYDFESLKILNADFEEVPHTVNAAGNFEFYMPAGDVTIDVTLKAHNFGLVVTNSRDSVVSPVYSGIKVDGSWADSKNYAPCGSDVRVILYPNTSSTTMPVGVKLTSSTGEETFVAMDEDGYCDFTMPAHAITVEVLVKTRTFPLAVVGTDNVALVAYTKVNDEYVALEDQENIEVALNDTLYFKAVADGENYSPRKVQADKFLYKSTMSSAYTSTSYASALTVNEEGFYSYTLTKIPTETVKIMIAGQNDANAFKDTNIVGNYVGFITWGSNQADVGISTGYNSVITSDGSWLEGSSQYYINEYGNTSGKGMYSNADGDRHYKFSYRDGVLFTSKDANNLVAANKYMFFKMRAGDDVGMYTVHAETLYGGRYVFAELLRNGVHENGLYVDQLNGTVIRNVTFDLIDGDYVGKLNSKYNAYIGDKLIASVGYKDTAVLANRVFKTPGTLEGTFYDWDDNEVVFDGFNHAYYLGKEWIVTINEYGEGRGVVADKSSKDTFTFRAFKGLNYADNFEYNEFISPLKGRTYTAQVGQYYLSSKANNSNNKVDTFTISFVDDTHLTYTCVTPTGTNVMNYALGTETYDFLSADEATIEITGYRYSNPSPKTYTIYTTDNWETFEVYEEYEYLLCQGSDYVYFDHGCFTLVK